MNSLTVKNETQGRRQRVKKLLDERNDQLNSLRKLLTLGLTLSNKDKESWAIFLEDASAPGEVRYQTFDKRGFSGHYTFHDLDSALKDAFTSGYRYVDDGALDRVSLTDEWNCGMAIQYIRDQYNAGKLSWDDMFSKINQITSAESDTCH